MNDQIVELVVYKVKQGLAGNFTQDILPKFQQLVKSFGGVVSYQTYGSVGKSGLYADSITWDSAASAKGAAAKFDELKTQGKHTELMDFFEEVILMDHFKPIS